MTTRRPKATLRVIGYVRISQLTEQSTSIQRQTELIQATCSARGWQLVGIEEDVDVSATKKRLNRPGLDRVRAGLAAGRADVVLVWRIDRLARSVRDLAELAEELSAKGAGIVSCSEPFDMTTPAGRAMLQLLSVFAELEAATIAERVSAGRAAMSKAGRHPGGPAPYGYRTAPNPNGPGRVLELDPTESAFVRQAADAVLAGTPLYRVVRQLNEAGSRSKQGSYWSRIKLARVLSGTAILGYQQYRGEVIRDEHGYPEQRFEAIVTPEESKRLNALLAPTNPGRASGRGRLLSSLLRCGTCGAKLHVTAAQGTRYMCAEGHRACTRPVAITADKVEAEVTKRFLEEVGDRQRVAITLITNEPAELVRTEEAIAAAGAALLAAVGERDDQEEVQALTARLRSLKAQRDELRAAPNEPELLLEDLGETWAEAWERLASSEDAVAEQRALLVCAINHVVVLPGKRGPHGLDPNRIRVDWEPFVQESA